MGSNKVQQNPTCYRAGIANHWDQCQVLHRPEHQLAMMFLRVVYVKTCGHLIRLQVKKFFFIRNIFFPDFKLSPCVLYVVCFLLGNSLVSEFYMLTVRNTLSVQSSQAGRCRVILHLLAYEDGTDSVFQNVGIQNSDAGGLPRRKQTIFFT